ncbi:MAG: hypothetical protein MZV70_53045 [Desulfobacterales bacterium]|nr:hypothetical protein [Desulfobacterales bacterium]
MNSATGPGADRRRSPQPSRREPKSPLRSPRKRISIIMIVLLERPRA